MKHLHLKLSGSMTRRYQTKVEDKYFCGINFSAAGRKNVREGMSLERQTI